LHKAQYVEFGVSIPRKSIVNVLNFPLVSVKIGLEYMAFDKGHVTNINSIDNINNEYFLEKKK
jgi:hypothetical protein